MPPSPVVITLRGCSEKHGERRRASRSGGPCSARRSRTRRPRPARGRGARRAPRNASMSAGRPSWCTGMIALVRLGDRALGRGRVEVEGPRVDVGEDRRRAALPDRVGGRDERHRRHDHLVAGADARDVAARGAARSCSSSSATASAAPTRSANARLELAHARALGDPAGGDHLGDRVALVAAQVGRLNGTSIRRLASERVGCGRGAGALAAPPLDEPGQALLEVDLGLEAELARARASVSASRRVTPLTARSGPCSTGEVGAHHPQQRLGELEQARLGRRWRR